MTADDLLIGPEQSLAIDPDWIGSEAFCWPVDPLLGPRLRYGLFESILRSVVADSANGAQRLLFARKALTIDLANRLLLQQLHHQVSGGHIGIMVNHEPQLLPVEQDHRQQELFISRLDRATPLKRWLAFHGQKQLLRGIDLLHQPRPLLQINQQPLPDDLRSQRCYRIRNPYSFLGRQQPGQMPPTHELAAITAVADRLSDTLHHLSQQLGIEPAIASCAGQQLGQYLVPQLVTAWHDASTIADVLRQRPIDCFLGSLGGYAASLLAWLAKQYGGRVYSSIHANFDFRFSNGVDMMETIAVDRFYCISQEAAERAERLAHRFWGPLWGQSPLTTVICPMQHHQGSADALPAIDRPAAAKPEQIMVMGMIANPRNMQGPMALPVQLHLEWRLCRLLVAAGYQVTYKAHPENTWLGHERLLGLAVAIERRPLEQVWQRTDAFVIVQAQSTTVQSVILRSDRPVCFLWHPDMDPCDPLTTAEMDMRCHVVPVWQDAAHRIVFDAQFLLEALQQPKPVSRELRYRLSR
ncbi:MAG: hypothetical protein HQL58_08755 [Magnetococcales bacterium]|nr:hypothetical protein [Magnetococcales bacterium]